MDQKNTEKSISEQLSDILPKLSKDQLRYIVALQEFPTKKEAAESIDIQPDTVYRWPATVDLAAKLIAMDITESARVMRKKSVAKAMAVKLAGLDSEDESIRQKSATEIIEWELGKAMQGLDLTSGGEKIIVTIKSDDE